MSTKADRLKRYFSGKYSRKDSFFVRKLFTEKEQQPDLAKELKKNWNDFELNTEQNKKDVTPLLNRIQHRIYLEENSRIHKLKTLHFLQRIAAILFIPLLFGFMGYLIFTNLTSQQVSYAEIQCPLGMRTQFVLPDGSSGFLNNGSKLKYSIPFSNSREVQLLGEAFFDVVKNGKPFHVKTDNLDVQVMGTTFNVIAYENDATEEVILQTGKVNITSSVNGKNLSHLIPDQQLIYVKESKEYLVKSVDANQFTAWREGKLIFRNEGLEDVAKRISRWYNVDVIIADSQLRNYTFHATFMNHSLEEVLQLLTFTSPMKFKIEDQTQNKSNIYLNKKQVTLELDQSKTNQFN